MSTPEGKHDELHETLCAYVFGELPGDEHAAFEARLERDPELRAEHDELVRTAGLVQDALPAETLPADMRETLTRAAEARARKSRFRLLPGGGAAWAAAAGLLLMAGAFLFQESRETPFAPESQVAWRDDKLRRAPEEEADRVAAPQISRENAPRSEAHFEDAAEEANEAPARDRAMEPSPLADAEAFAKNELGESPIVDEVAATQEKRLERENLARSLGYFDSGDVAEVVPPGLDDGPVDGEDPVLAGSAIDVEVAQGASVASEKPFRGPGDTVPPGEVTARAPQSPATELGEELRRQRLAPALGFSSDASEPPIKFRENTIPPSELDDLRSGEDGFFLGRGKAGVSGEGGDRGEFLEGFDGFARIGFRSNKDMGVARDAEPDGEALAKTFPWLTVVQSTSDGGFWARQSLERGTDLLASIDDESLAFDQDDNSRKPVLTGEQLEALGSRLLGRTRVLANEEPASMFFRFWGARPYVRTADDRLSTFSIDVDTSSYALARATLDAGRLPQHEQVRTEEFVNYFRADVEPPTDGPFRIAAEVAPTPFVPADTELLRVSVRAEDIEDFERQPLALTCVIDVSTSMKEGGRLNLVKRGLKRMLGALAPTDALSLVTFSEEARVALPMTTAGSRATLERVIDGLELDGGTNVEAGLWTGFEHAAQNLTTHAVNRVLLFSDGVGNIGETDQTRILERVAGFRSQGIYLNTLGVGMGNHDEVFLEQLADRGDGVSQYIDSDDEAQKVLVDDLRKAVQPVARDVKIQVEFDPAEVLRYRQLGYENRVIADRDFRNDAVDAGEVNAGHQVTALYEIVRTGRNAAPLATVRVRYKPPFAVDRGALGRQASAEAEVALELEQAVSVSELRPAFASASFGFRRAVLVAQFAEVLRRSVHTRGDSLETLVAEVRRLADAEPDPELEEFLRLLVAAQPHLDARAAQDANNELANLLDELARLHFEKGAREQTLAEGEELDADVEAAADEEIVRLEGKVREYLRSVFDVDEPALQRLRDMGYNEDYR